MIKILSTIIEAIYWLMLFLCPALVFGIISAVIYLKYNNLLLPIIYGATGVVLGIWFAEKIRRKYGTSNFYGRLLRTPELENKNSTNDSAI